MKLSEHFTLEELCVTSCGLNNSLDPDKKEDRVYIDNLSRLVDNYLEPLRVFQGEPVIINSAYRTKEVNRLVGGAKNSYHTLGLAADIHCEDLKEAFVMLSFLIIRSDQFFFQMNKLAEIILYVQSDTSIWIHIAMRKDAKDKKDLVLIKQY